MIYPLACALCGAGLNRWYYCLRAPMCPCCADKQGPVLHPSRWQISARHASPAARRVWEAWAAAA